MTNPIETKVTDPTPAELAQLLIYRLSPEQRASLVRAHQGGQMGEIIKLIRGTV